jgi:hypothetical protein
MDKLQKLVNPDIYNVEQLIVRGYNNKGIQIYCEERFRKWMKAVYIFRSIFIKLGNLFIHKQYQENKKNMKVSIYDMQQKLLVEEEHVDPIFALAECAKKLNNEDDFLSALLSNMKI